MIDSKVIQRLNSEVSRLKSKYNLKTTKDLEQIAKAEYRVTEVVNTPLVCDVSMAIQDNGRLYIFYYATFKPRETHALGHELGHIVAGIGRSTEAEADYFSQLLNDISPAKMFAYRLIEATVSPTQSWKNLFNSKSEIKRLKQIGVYDILKKTCKTILSLLLYASFEVISKIKFNFKTK